MKIPQLMLASVALAFFVGSPAVASVTIESASLLQGVLVHGTGVEQTGTEVIGNLGSGGPNIVHFTGNTTETAGLVDRIRLQGGSGQADITGAEITPGGTPNDVYNLISGDIFLANHAGMEWIEFGLTGFDEGGTVDFLITLLGGGTVSFLDQPLGGGDTFWGFLASDGDLITNVHYSADNPPGELTILKQVRINAAVPEPATWAMMLLGFAAVGYQMRKRRPKVQMQIA